MGQAGIQGSRLSTSNYRAIDHGNQNRHQSSVSCGDCICKSKVSDPSLKCVINLWYLLCLPKVRSIVVYSIQNPSIPTDMGAQKTVTRSKKFRNSSDLPWISSDLPEIRGMIWFLIKNHYVQKSRPMPPHIFSDTANFEVRPALLGRPCENKCLCTAKLRIFVGPWNSPSPLDALLWGPDGKFSWRSWFLSRFLSHPM